MIRPRGWSGRKSNEFSRGAQRNRELGRGVNTTGDRDSLATAEDTEAAHVSEERVHAGRLFAEAPLAPTKVPHVAAFVSRSNRDPDLSGTAGGGSVFLGDWDFANGAHWVTAIH